MKIDLILVGKTTGGWIKTALDEYTGRLKHYTDFQIKEIQTTAKTGNLPPEQQRTMEGRQLIKLLNEYDMVTLLDERGTSYTSEGFAGYLQQRMNRGTRRHAFVAGGAFGFSDEVYQRKDPKMSLSEMTFSHQMVRVFFVEQLYRAFTILRGESYHHS